MLSNFTSGDGDTLYTGSVLNIKLSHASPFMVLGRPIELILLGSKDDPIEGAGAIMAHLFFS